MIESNVLGFILFRISADKGRIKFSHAIKIGDSYVLFLASENGEQLLDGGIRFWPKTGDRQVFNPLQLAGDEYKAYKNARILTLGDLLSKEKM